MKGLTNFGATCYFNSIVQCLLQTPPLTNILLVKKYDGDCKITDEFQKLAKKMWQGDENEKVLSPLDLFREFANKYRDFNSRQQQDAQEALLILLDVFEKELKFVPDIFNSEMEQETVYPKGTSKTKEKMAVHMINVVKDCSIKEALDEYTKWNVVDGYTDNDNVTYRFANVKKYFRDLPKVLVLTFSMYVRKNRIKLDEEIEIEGTRYCLYASCVHYGNTQKGHYVAFTKHKEQWYLKDDDICQKVDNFPLDDYHYIVFFKKIS